MSKPADPLMKVAIPLAKKVLAPLGITAAASAIDAGIVRAGLGNKKGKGTEKRTSAGKDWDF